MSVTQADFAAWLHEEVLQPTVLVISTEKAKETLYTTNGLSFAELFAPFGGYVNKIPIQYKVLDKVISQNAIKFAFMDDRSLESIEALFPSEGHDGSSGSSAANQHTFNHLVESESSLPILRENLRSLENSSQRCHWYRRWRNAYAKSLRMNEFECFDQPFAVILVAMSTEADPVGIFEQLLHNSSMPPLCRKGILDSNPPRLKVLLHDLADPSSPPAERAENILSQMKKNFHPPSCTILRINRSETDLLSVAAQGVRNPLQQASSNSATPNPGRQQEREKLIRVFSPHLNPSIHTAASKDEQKPAGAMSMSELEKTGGENLYEASNRPNFVSKLALSDCHELQQLVRGVILNLAVPWIERKISQLEQQVSNNRKGFHNQMKALFRKPKETAEIFTASSDGRAENSAAYYSLQSTEGQTRLAADLCFLLREYEHALTLYKSAVGDYKQDKNWRHVAACYEAQGLCMFLSGLNNSGTAYPASEWERCLSNAYEFYIKGGKSFHATRVLIFWICMSGGNSTGSSLQKNQTPVDFSAVLTVTNYLMKATAALSTVDILAQALFLEQTALLLNSIARPRKHAFHLVLAGHTYQKIGSKKLALRCYAAVFRYSLHSDWIHIDQHLHFTMARHCYGVGLYTESVYLFHSLLRSFSYLVAQGRTLGTLPDRESTYLREYTCTLRMRQEKGGNVGAAKSVGLKPLRLDLPKLECPREQVLVSLQGDAEGRSNLDLLYESYNTPLLSSATRRTPTFEKLASLLWYHLARYRQVVPAQMSVRPVGVDTTLSNRRTQPNFKLGITDIKSLFYRLGGPALQEVDSVRVLAPGTTFTVQVSLFNHLQVHLAIKDLRLMGTFVFNPAEGSAQESTRRPNVVFVNSSKAKVEPGAMVVRLLNLDVVNFSPREKKKIVFHGSVSMARDEHGIATNHQTWDPNMNCILHLYGMSWRFIESVDHLRNPLVLYGKKVKGKHAAPSTLQYFGDKRLFLQVKPAPTVLAEPIDFPKELFTGETRQGGLRIKYSRTTVSQISVVLHPASLLKFKGSLSAHCTIDVDSGSDDRNSVSSDSLSEVTLPLLFQAVVAKAKTEVLRITVVGIARDGTKAWSCLHRKSSWCRFDYCSVCWYMFTIFQVCQSNDVSSILKAPAS